MIRGYFWYVVYGSLPCCWRESAGVCGVLCSRIVMN